MDNLINRLRCTHSVGSWATADDQRVEAADAIEKLIQQRDELLAALQLAYRTLPYSTHPDAFEAVGISKRAITRATQSTTTTE